MSQSVGRVLTGLAIALVAVACGQAAVAPSSSQTPGQPPPLATGAPTSVPPPTMGVPTSIPSSTLAPGAISSPAAGPGNQVSPTVPAPATQGQARPAGTAVSAPTKATGGGTDTVLDRLIDKGKQDLAQRVGVPTSEITLVSSSPEEWRDSSLGCPQPGGMYAQVITPGYRIVLQARGNRHEYHSDSTSRVVYCQNPS